jgi:TolB-like protein/DNA-binding winged helix-turn-helix (wHTH) protein/Flp pilus assembly protein TadD
MEVTVAMRREGRGGAFRRNIGHRCGRDGPAQSSTMAPQAWTTDTRDLTPDPAGYEVDDLIIDLAPRRVRRAGTVIPLKALSFDLLVTLVRAAPNLLSFDQLSERVWPGLVITPETIVQRVKLLRSALGDDPHAPRYIEGVRGRGYRMIAEVRPLTERQGTGESIVPPSLNETKEEESPDVHAGIAATEGVAASAPAATPSAAPRPARWGPLGWIGGTLITMALVAASIAVVHYRGMSKSAERTSSGAAAAIHSLAVLPLENLSGGKDQEYFADGMTDALTTDLAQIGSLRVISRTSAMQFKGSKETLPQIGRDLKVDAVVEGAVTQGENRVRVTAQLVEASSDHHLWARTYERDLKDVLALQDEIARDIAEQIRVKLTPKERSLLIQVHAVDPEAYDAYLRGSFWLNQATLEGFEKGCDYFQKAIAKDPGYALAYVGVAECTAIRAPDQARQAMAKALMLDPSLAEAHTWLATMKLMNDWDFSGAEAEHKQAIALNPNDASAHHWYSFYLVAMGRLDEAMREIERARDLNPYDVLTTAWVAQVLYHARRYDEALREMQLGLEMHPDTGGFYWDMADVYEQKKMFAEAFAARQRALSLMKDPRVTALGEAYQRSGYEGYLLKQAEFEQTHNPPYAAHIYALLNDEPRAIAALEAAYKKRLGGILFMRSAPELDSIRSSPGFRGLVRRIGFPPSPSDRN